MGEVIKLFDLYKPMRFRVQCEKHGNYLFDVMLNPKAKVDMAYIREYAGVEECCVIEPRGFWPDWPEDKRTPMF